MGNTQMPLVASEQEVIENIERLRSYKDGTEKEKIFHNDLIKRGRIFVARQYGEQHAFAPSRFVGYRSNTLDMHQPKVADGRLTNVALNGIFGPPLDSTNVDSIPYNTIVTAFRKYRENLQIPPIKIPNQLKFWLSSGIDNPQRGASDSDNQRDRNDAIDDIGTDHPDTRSHIVVSYSRDPAIRQQVMKRAKGYCEYCNKPGFARANDELYLESHHIIALASDGADRMTNVIALCPNDHREAHFGKRQSELENEMILKLKQITDAER